MIVPLKRMPLTPNGKIDKNALPFPDTALLPAPSPTTNTDELTPIQSSIRDIWATVLNQPATGIPIDDNFFDLGGHSILATRLVFIIRKDLKVDVPLGIVYKEPTVRGMSAEVEKIRGGDLGFAAAGQNVSANIDVPVQEEEEVDYAADLDVIDDPTLAASWLPEFSFPPLEGKDGRPVFFLTGVTGFLGAFILGGLLRRCPTAKVIALVRAKNVEDASGRMRANGQRHLIWDEAWVEGGRVQAICGDLSLDRLGLSQQLWDTLSEEVDIIVHNGALVHWVYPYHKLRAPNVLGTLWSLRLATTHHLKPVHFVSSTSVLDTEHYVELGERGKVMESDDLEGARRGLRSGYGQSKWVAEKLVMRARGRGVPATIIRPGYIVGDSTTAVGNTDDFLWRLVKGCVQLGQVPRIANVVNMCPVDYVAGVVCEVAASPKALDLGVFHCYNSEHFRFDDMFSHLIKAGYAVKPTDYILWRAALMDLTLSQADNALYPLLHFVLDDLPTSTKSAELDDGNVKIVIGDRLQCKKIAELMPIYLGYLVEIGFMEGPPEGGAGVVRLNIWDNLQGGSVGRNRG